MKHQLIASSSANDLREAAFKQAFEVTKSADACGYVSDDFSLIADAIRAEVSDPWLSGLLATYLEGGFPFGKLSPDMRSFGEILAE